MKIHLQSTQDLEDFLSQKVRPVLQKAVLDEKKVVAIQFIVPVSNSNQPNILNLQLGCSNE